MIRLSRVLAPALLAAAAAALAACDSPTVPARTIAYDFTFEGFGERLIYRWPTGSTIGVYVVPGHDAESSAVLEDAFRHTANAWNDAVLFGEYRIVRAPLEDADVVLAWANTMLPVETKDCPPFPSGFAWTTFCSDSTFERITTYPLSAGEHSEDGVHMLVQVLDSPTTEGNVAALVAHEFGHVLGIGTHPCRLGQVGCTRRDGAHESLMYAGMPERSTPSAADRSTIEVLYQSAPHLTP